MSKRPLITLGMVLVLLGLSLPLSAQTLGKIGGHVTDPDGADLPGVMITTTSEALMGGTRSAVTGATGDYRLSGLPAGVYSVRAELEGFQPQTIENVRVSINATATVNFALFAEFAEELTVSGESPLVEVTASAVPTNYSSDFIKDLPTNRNFYDMLSVSPGVATSSEGSDRQIAFGANMQSNAWHIDGLEASAPETGTAWIYTNPDTIEEIQVLGVGAPAEFGNLLGAAFNVVTKSGSNQVKGNFNAYYQDDAFTDSKKILPDNEYPDWTRNEFWDVTATLGGPIKKDRLWYFAAYEYWRDNIAEPGLDPDFVRTGYTDTYDLKFSVRFNDSNLLDVKGQYSNWGYPEAYANYTPSATPEGENGFNVMWAFNYNTIFTDRTFMEVKFSGWDTDDDYLSLTGSTEPAFIDYSPPGGGPPLYSGGLWYPWLYETGTQQGDVSVSHFADEFLGGEHDFKFGVRYSDGYADAFGALAGKYYYRYVYEYEYYGTIYPYEYFYKVEYAPYYYGADQTALSFYVDDAWKVNDRLTLNLGLRFDRHQASIADFPRLDIDGNPTGEIIPGIDPVFTWNNWSPRIGFAYNAGANYNTVIRGYFGVFYDGNVSGNWDAPPPEAPVWTGYWSDSLDGPWEEFWTWQNPPSSVDPDLKTPRTLQYMLGFERQVKTNYSYGAMLVYKDTTDLIGFENLGDGVYEPFLFVDPFTGEEYTLLSQVEQPTTRKGNRPGFTAVGYLDEYWQEYWGVVLTFNRRFADWWSLRANYTLSESTGLIPTMLRQTQFNPPYGWYDDGRDPNHFVNADGQHLQGDRAHMFRVQGNFELPWNLHASTSINLQSGRPYSRQTDVRGMGQGTTTVIMEPASDDQRHGFQNIVDFSIGKRFPFGGDSAVKFDVQIFNLLNSDVTDSFSTLRLLEGDEFVPDWWVLPRRIMLRLGVEF